MSAGIAWAIISGLAFGVFQVINRKALDGIDSYRSTFLLIFISAIILSVAAALTQDLSLLWHAPLKSVALFAAAGFIHFFGGWTFLSLSQRQIGAARTGALIGASPLFGTLGAVIVLGEIISIPALIGVILIVAGVYLVTS